MSNAISAEKILDEIEQNFVAPPYIKNVQDSEWHLFLADADFDPAHIIRRDTLAEDSADKVILRVREPEFSPCPPLPESLMGWISTPNWDNYKTASVQVREEISRPVEGKGHVPENFEADEARLSDLTDWQNARAAWREQELVTERTRALFAELYKVLDKLTRHGDNYDLWLGDVVFARKNDASLNYPLLLKKVVLRLTEDGAMEVTPTDGATVFYGELLEGLADVHGLAAQKMTEKYAVHFTPLSPNLEKLLPRLASVISPACRFTGNKVSFKSDDVYAVAQRPVLVLCPHNPNLSAWFSSLRLTAADAESESEAPLSADIFSANDIAEPEVIYYDEPQTAGRAVIDGLAAGLVVDTPPGTRSAAYAAQILRAAMRQGKHILVGAAEPAFLAEVWRELPETWRTYVAAPAFVAPTRTWQGLKELLGQAPGELTSEIDGLTTEKTAAETNKTTAEEKLNALLQEELSETYAWEGRNFSRREMAEFVAAHRHLAELIPGEVQKGIPLPLTDEELAFLYRVCKDFDSRTRADMAQDLPPLTDLPSAYSYEGFLREWQDLDKRQAELLKELPGWQVNENDRLVSPGGEILPEFDQDSFRAATTAYRELAFSWLDFPWAKEAILAGQQGGGKRQVWDQLGRDILTVQRMKDEAVALLLGKVIECPAEVLTDEDALKELAACEKILPETGRGKLPVWMRLLNRRRSWLCRQITINGKEISCQEDCRTAMRYIELQRARAKVQVEWDQLMAPCGGQTYAELKEQGDDVDDLCSARWQQIQYCLDWYDQKYRLFCGQILGLGLDTDRILPEGKFMTPHQRLGEDIAWLKSNWPRFEAILRLLYIDKRSLKRHEDTYINAVADDESRLGKRIRQALEDRDASAYRIALSLLKRYKSLSLDYAQAQKLLAKLRPVAAEWAASFDNLSDNAEEETEPPQFADLVLAWQYRQFSAELTGKQVTVYAAERELAAAASALKEIDERLDEKLMRRALMQQLADKELIDAALGEDAPDNIMALPLAWLLTPREAAELNFRERADIALIGAAEQGGAELLPFALLAKTPVLLGDEKQLISGGKTINLPDLPTAESLYHLYRPHLPHAELTRQYEAVPEIMGYANHFLYRHKLIPLRPEGMLKPIITYNIGGVYDTERGINEAEAENIVSVLSACVNEAEYEHKTFGAVTLTQKAQADFIGDLALKNIGTGVLAKHKFIFGTVRELQGTRRDVVFLSLVQSPALPDSGDIQSPFGAITDNLTDEDFSRLVNVATNLAAEQLWVIHSAAGDELPQEPLRLLLDYAAHSENYAAPVANMERATEDNDDDVMLAEDTADMLQELGWYARDNWPTGEGGANVAVFDGDKIAAVTVVGVKEDKSKNGAALSAENCTQIHLLPAEFIKDGEQSTAALADELTRRGFTPQPDPATVKDNLIMRVMINAQRLLGQWEDERTTPETESEAEDE